ncbi:hypothetical protein [Chryseobacterium turcicum]|uniref:Lipoprotein n=1 Tax=Chryseobacterium turcicum TaxID=2898076 RepID=A0A9Q3V2I7_9FLAO|nr:hypothetical protein [Chryseobacterium turcicum]MCD1115495.1 hypothetical protein [Chryseobacterium turcicum]
MNKFLLILIVLLTACKEEKNLTENIVLDFPKDEKLTFQEFNENLTHRGTSLIYIGEIRPQIVVKYYKYIKPPATPYNDDIQKQEKKLKILLSCHNNLSSKQKRLKFSKLTKFLQPS